MSNDNALASVPPPDFTNDQLASLESAALADSVYWNPTIILQLIRLLREANTKFKVSKQDFAILKSELDKANEYLKEMRVTERAHRIYCLEIQVQWLKKDLCELNVCLNDERNIGEQRLKTIQELEQNLAQQIDFNQKRAADCTRLQSIVDDFHVTISKCWKALRPHIDEHDPVWFIWEHIEALVKSREKSNWREDVKQAVEKLNHALRAAEQQPSGGERIPESGC